MRAVQSCTCERMTKGANGSLSSEKALNAGSLENAIDTASDRQAPLGDRQSAFKGGGLGRPCSVALINVNEVRLEVSTSVLSEETSDFLLEELRGERLDDEVISTGCY
jgi:hypothetical protein